MFVCCECCALSGRGLCDELITRPKDSYRLWRVVVCDLETSWMRRSWPTGGCCPKNKTNKRKNPSACTRRLEKAVILSNIVQNLSPSKFVGLHAYVNYVLHLINIQLNALLQPLGLPYWNLTYYITDNSTKDSRHTGVIILNMIFHFAMFMFMSYHKFSHSLRSYK